MADDCRMVSASREAERGPLGRATTHGPPSDAAGTAAASLERLVWLPSQTQAVRLGDAAAEGAPQQRDAAADEAAASGWMLPGARHATDMTEPKHAGVGAQQQTQQMAAQVQQHSELQIAADCSMRSDRHDDERVIQMQHDENDPEPAAEPPRMQRQPARQLLLQQ